MASLIAGTRDGANIERNMHGIAFDADLVFKQVDLISDVPGDAYARPINLDVLTEEDDKQIAARFFDMDYARAAGAGIINFSFGVDGHADLYAEELVRAKLKHTAAALEQKGVRPPTKSSLSFPPGTNAKVALGHVTRGIPGKPHFSGRMGGLGVHFPELRGHVLAVAAVGQDGLLEDYSNPCGSAKIFCLVAPGENLTAANYGLGNPEILGLATPPAPQRWSAARSRCCAVFPR